MKIGTINTKVYNTYIGFSFCGAKGKTILNTEQGDILDISQKESRVFNKQYNNATTYKEKFEIMRKWLGAVGEETYIQDPVFIDYGKNLFLGKRVFFNVNCSILDNAKITIGDDSLFGPGVKLCTPSHPINPELRKTGKVIAKPINIGKNCWIGAGAIILGGVNIGNNSVIGAGSVVTKDIPSDVVAFGTPARVIRSVYDKK